MDGELKNLIKVWILASTGLSYCYYIASRIPKGMLRLFSLLPIFYFFITLPLNLSSFHFCGPTSFFLVWLATFKLLLFSFDQGPLVSPPPPNVFHFICLSCLPIKLLDKKNIKNPSHQKNLNEKSTTSPNPSDLFMPRSFLLAIKMVLLVILFHSYKYKNYVHPYVVLALYCLHAYLELEIVLAICATPARILFRSEFEPQFDEPYLATSLQDFWGHRWNLMVTSILRPTVYHPVRRISMSVIGLKWASLPAMIATFVVSGLMHEIIYFYITRVSPTWEVMWFFVLHGVCVAIEVTVKKVVAGRWQLNQAISGPLTVAFVGVTGVWLFFPQLLRNGIDEKAIREYSILVNFVMKLKNS